MKKSSIIWLIIVIVIIVVVGVWYWSAGQTSSNPNLGQSPSSASSTVVGAAPAQIIVLETTSTNNGTTSLGTFLVAMNGMTLYQYTKDTPGSGSSTCTGQCAAVWPPYTVPATEETAALVGDSGANGQVGVIDRADGSYQVTYNGIPLYFYAKDKNVGDTTGQNVGGVWFVVTP